MELIVSQKPYEIEYMKETCKMVGETYEDVIKIYNKNHLLIDQFKIQDLVGGMSRLLLLFDFESIIQNLSRVIYYSILSNVCKQISRIIEVYIKINEDKSLFLLGIKKMQEVKSENDWVKIKIEELLIKRLMRRQSELAAVFNAENNPFYVNGYMLARLTDSNLDMVINELKNEPGICYKESVNYLAIQHHFTSIIPFSIRGLK